MFLKISGVQLPAPPSPALVWRACAEHPQSHFSLNDKTALRQHFGWRQLFSSPSLKPATRPLPSPWWSTPCISWSLGTKRRWRRRWPGGGRAYAGSTWCPGQCASSAKGRGCLNLARRREIHKGKFKAKLTQRRLKVASHRIRLRLTIRLMANGSLHTGSVGRIRVDFLVSDRLPAHLKLFWVSRIAAAVGDGVLAACGKTDVGHPSRIVSRNRIVRETALRIFNKHSSGYERPTKGSDAEHTSRVPLIAGTLKTPTTMCEEGVKIPLNILESALFFKIQTRLWAQCFKVPRSRQLGHRRACWAFLPACRSHFNLTCNALALDEATGGGVWTLDAFWQN